MRSLVQKKKLYGGRYNNFLMEESTTFILFLIKGGLPITI